MAGGLNRCLREGDMVVIPNEHYNNAFTGSSLSILSIRVLTVAQSSRRLTLGGDPW